MSKRVKPGCMRAPCRNRLRSCARCSALGSGIASFSEKRPPRTTLESMSSRWSRRAHQKHLVIRVQAADFCKKLLHQLNIVLGEVALVCGQKPMHLIDEHERWIAFLRPGEHCSHTLDRIPDSSA